MSTKIIQGTIHDENLTNAISNLLTSADFSWYWNEHQVTNSKELVQVGGFTHCFYTLETSVNSAYYSIATSLIEKVQDKINVEFIFRAQANFLCNVKMTEEMNNNLLHIDNISEDYFSILYYVLSSDGDTVVYNEYGLPFNISPIKGNYVIFPSNFLHKATPPKDNKKRVVINIIVKGSLKE